MAPDQAIAMLQSSGNIGAKLFVLTESKFDAQKVAKTFNIEAGYAADPLHLQTLSAWSGVRTADDECLLDAIEVFALRSLVERDGPFDHVVLQRSPASLEARWSEEVAKLAERPFVDLGAGNFLLAGSKPGVGFIETLWRLYASGALYGLGDYRFDAALTIAADALRLNV